MNDTKTNLIVAVAVVIVVTTWFAGTTLSDYLRRPERLECIHAGGNPQPNGECRRACDGECRRACDDK